jgi:hypothetical protein
MAMQTDVKATSLGASGVVFEGRARVKGRIIGPTGNAGNVTLSNGGTNVFAIQTTANGETFNALIPGEGVVFTSNVYATLLNATVTVFYG